MGLNLPTGIEKHLDNLSDNEIMGLNLPTGIEKHHDNLSNDEIMGLNLPTGIEKHIDNLSDDEYPDNLLMMKSWDLIFQQVLKIG